MTTAIFSTHIFDREYLIEANRDKHDLLFIDTRLNAQTGQLARHCQAVGMFVPDHADATVMKI